MLITMLLTSKQNYCRIHKIWLAAINTEALMKLKSNKTNLVRFEVLTVTVMKIAIFWHAAPCSLSKFL
jgi:hypothetical protein